MFLPTEIWLTILPYVESLREVFVVAQVERSAEKAVASLTETESLASQICSWRLANFISGEDCGPVVRFALETGRTRFAERAARLSACAAASFTTAYDLFEFLLLDESTDSIYCIADQLLRFIPPRHRRTTACLCVRYFFNRADNLRICGLKNAPALFNATCKMLPDAGEHWIILKLFKRQLYDLRLKEFEDADRGYRYLDVHTAFCSILHSCPDLWTRVATSSWMLNFSRKTSLHLVLAMLIHFFGNHHTEFEVWKVPLFLHARAVYKQHRLFYVEAIEALAFSSRARYTYEDMVGLVALHEIWQDPAIEITLDELVLADCKLRPYEQTDDPMFGFLRGEIRKLAAARGYNYDFSAHPEPPFQPPPVEIPQKSSSCILQ